MNRVDSLLALALALALALPALPGLAHAHAFNPAVLELVELGGGRVAVAFKTTVTPGGTTLEPVLPDRCRTLVPPQREGEGTAGASIVVRWSLDCGESGLSGTWSASAVSSSTASKRWSWRRSPTGGFDPPC